MVAQDIRAWVTGWANKMFYERAAYLKTSSGAPSTGRPVVLNALGKLDVSFLSLSPLGALIDSLTAKATPVGADELLLADSAAAFVGKKLTWTNVVATLTTAFNALYAPLSHVAATVVHGATGAVVGTTNSQTLSSKTLTTPVIADFTNAQHDHLATIGGGVLNYLPLVVNSDPAGGITGAGRVKIDAPFQATAITGRQVMTTGTTGENVISEAITIADITRFQVLTIDLTISSGIAYGFVTDFALSLQRVSGGSGAANWALAYGKVSWSGTGASTFTVRDSTTSFKSAGTVTGSVTAITGGIRISISSTDYSNTLNTNMFFHTTTGSGANGITVTMTIT